MPDLSVADNIAITNPPQPLRPDRPPRPAPPRRGACWRASAPRTSTRSTPVQDLPLSRRQMVEIAKALARDPKLLILDEATSALTAADVDKVFAMLKRLRDEGLGILYISHRMHEIEELADQCTVFRNGRHIETLQGAAQDRRRDRRADDRPRIQPRLPAEADAEPSAKPPVLAVAEPDLDRPSERRLAERRHRRDRRPRRPRRPGPERAAAGAVRRAARRHGRDPDRRQDGVGQRPARRQGRVASAWRWSPRTARPRG